MSGLDVVLLQRWHIVTERSGLGGVPVRLRCGSTVDPDLALSGVESDVSRSGVDLCQRCDSLSGGRLTAAADAPSSIPGPDPLVTATQWLNLHSDCDIECKQNHPVNHSTVSGLHAAAATARMFASEYKRERDELQVLLIDAVAQLRALAGRSPVPPAGALRLLASRLEQDL